MTDYERIEKAILYIKDNFKEQPELDVIAKHVQVSPFHFQRLFREWAGVSPKKFLQYISIQHAKNLLKQRLPLSEVSFETGLSGTSRLYDLFITIEGMTPGEYKNGAENLKINYNFSETPFGKVIMASTEKGICHISFCNDEPKGHENLKSLFPFASFIQKTDQKQQDALKIFSGDRRNISQIKLHLRGTAFQLKVWEALLQIPFAGVSSYSIVAENIHAPKAVRAVGTAVANNPVAVLIPCHRVIRSTGIIGEYHWGSIRKTAILGWEAAKTFAEN